MQFVCSVTHARPRISERSIRPFTKVITKIPPHAKVVGLRYLYKSFVSRRWKNGNSHNTYTRSRPRQEFVFWTGVQSQEGIRKEGNSSDGISDCFCLIALHCAKGSRFLSSGKRPDRVWGPLICPSNGYRRTLPQPKRPGIEYDHSLLSSCEVKNA
jgi:hypothetical protein